MKPSNAKKPYEIISENPKMDTSGMAGQPMPMPTYEFKMPSMSLRDMLEQRERKAAKRSETED